MPKSIITSFRVDDDLWHKIRVYAVKNRITMKDLMENLLELELKKNMVLKKIESKRR